MNLERDAAEYWSTDDAARHDMSHWYRARPERWLRVARRTRRQLAPHIAHARVAVEWGPGGGANVVALHGIAETIYGVDISAANLAECQRQAKGQDFRPVLIDVEEPEVAEIPRADLFLCVSVLQYLPTKAYARRILTIASRTLRPGGGALWQIRRGDDARPGTLYAETAIRRVAWQPGEFEAALTAEGFRVIDESHGYYVAKRH